MPTACKCPLHSRGTAPQLKYTWNLSEALSKLTAYSGSGNGPWSFALQPWWWHENLAARMIHWSPDTITFCNCQLSTILTSRLVGSIYTWCHSFGKVSQQSTCMNLHEFAWSTAYYINFTWHLFSVASYTMCCFRFHVLSSRGALETISQEMEIELDPLEKHVFTQHWLGSQTCPTVPLMFSLNACTSSECSKF